MIHLAPTNARATDKTLCDRVVGSLNEPISSVVGEADCPDCLAAMIEKMQEGIARRNEVIRIVPSKYAPEIGAWDLQIGDRHSIHISVMSRGDLEKLANEIRSALKPKEEGYGPIPRPRS